MELNTAVSPSGPTDVTSKLRVAVVGAWHVHTFDYARQVRDHPGTDLVAVWDDDTDRGRAAADQLGVDYTDDLPGLLGRDDVDAITVTTETSVHSDVMLAALAAGKHVFTEKLLAPTVGEAESIIKAADQYDRALMVSLPRLYHGYTQAITEVINSGALGRLTYARVRLSHDGAVSNWLPERFYDPVPAIGGALTDLGCHPVYLTQLFLGATPDTVSATYRSVTDRPVEDHAVVTVGYPDQAIGVIEAGFVSPNPFTIDLGGTAGTLSYSDADNSLRVSGEAWGGGKTWHALEVPEHQPMAFNQWVDHIGAGTRADDNLARAVELTRLVEAANESAATGRTVSYPR